MIEYDTDVTIAGHVTPEFLREIRDTSRSSLMEFQSRSEALAAELDEPNELLRLFETIGVEAIGNLVVFGKSDEILREVEKICVRHQMAFVSRIFVSEGRNRDYAGELRIFAPEHEDVINEVLTIPATVEMISIEFLRNLMDEKGPQQVAKMLSYAASPNQVLPVRISVSSDVTQSLQVETSAPKI